MLLAALFLFQHVILPDLPKVDKNPFTSQADIAQGADFMPAGARAVMDLTEMEAKAQTWPHHRFRAALPI
jgi:hypothetical protein